MRILVLANVPPGAVGGAEVQALRLAQCWSDGGHTVLIAGPKNEYRNERGILTRPIPLLRQTPLLRGVSYSLATLWLLWSQRRNYDLIYCRFLGEQAFVASLARTLFGLRQPLMACPACSGTIGEAARIRNSRYRRLLLTVFDRGISCVNATSQRIAAEIRALGLIRPLLTAFPNGVEVPAVPPDRARDSPVPLAICVGRLVAQKGLDVLIHALRTVADKGHHLEMKVVGDGPMRPSLEALVRETGLSDTVSFIGYVPPDKIVSHLKSADFFVLPSRDEGMPGALLEAIAAGLPAVVTRCGGAEDIVDDSIGWVVPPGDPQALAQALIAALAAGRDVRREMGIRAHRKAIRTYEIGQVARRHVELFYKLTDRLPTP